MNVRWSGSVLKRSRFTENPKHVSEHDVVICGIYYREISTVPGLRRFVALWSAVNGGGQTLLGRRVSLLNLRILRQDLVKLMCDVRSGIGY